MKALNIMEATVYTSPNPLTLICSQNEDGTTNLAPICFVSYLSFNPPMVGFATGKQSHTGKRVRETSKVIVTVPGESLAGVMGATLQEAVEVGDHILHICQVDKFLGNEDKKGLYAWNGFGKVAPAVEG